MAHLTNKNDLLNTTFLEIQITKATFWMGKLTTQQVMLKNYIAK